MLIQMLQSGWLSHSYTISNYSVVAGDFSFEQSFEGTFLNAIQPERAFQGEKLRRLTIGNRYLK